MKQGVRRGGVVESNNEESREGGSSGGGGGGDLQCWICSDLTRAWGASRLFSLSFSSLKGKIHCQTGGTHH